MACSGPAQEWEVEAVRLAAARVAGLGLVPTHRALWAASGIGRDRARRACEALRRRGDWPFPVRAGGAYRSPGPADLAALAASASPPPGMPAASARAHRLGRRPRDDVGPRELRARSICERVRAAQGSLDRARGRPEAPPRTNREWCRVYLSDWRARRRRDRERRVADGVADGRGGRGAA